MNVMEYTEFEITVDNPREGVFQKYGSKARDQNKDTEITGLFG